MSMKTKQTFVDVTGLQLKALYWDAHQITFIISREHDPVRGIWFHSQFSENWKQIKFSYACFNCSNNRASSLRAKEFFAFKEMSVRSAQCKPIWLFYSFFGPWSAAHAPRLLCATLYSLTTLVQNYSLPSYFKG